MKKETKKFSKITGFVSRLAVSVVVFSLPVIAMAQSTFSAPRPTASNNSALTDFGSLIAKLMSYIGQLIPFVIALTILVFIWGLFKMVFSGSSEANFEEGRKYVTFGIVALFVMVSVWGLVRILTKTFFNDEIFIPQLRTTWLIEQSDSKRV